jgi:hypothetical protein
MIYRQSTSSERRMFLFILARHLIWSRQNGDGGTSYYYYYDEITWIVGGLALVWLTWFLLSRYRRSQALTRRPRNTDYKLLKRIARIKSELSSQYLTPGFSTTIHAVGVGRLAGGGDYCIQVFLSDPNQEIWIGAGVATLPATYRGIPVVAIEMPRAGFLTDAKSDSLSALDHYPNGIRERQETIIGGISGANTNLAGQSGTIGYFCTRRSRLLRRKEIYLLSNSHVFADLRKTEVDEGDLIMQPSPGEPASNRPIGMLENFSPVKFDVGIKDPNHVDAAIARLWQTQRHNSVIPLIGALKGYVKKGDVTIGESTRKFGRTTGYTEGRIFSIYLDIWIQYDRTGQSAFFQNQFLIEPVLPEFTKFVSKGDSGSLVVDAEQHAIGLIFGGTSETARSTRPAADTEVTNTLPKVEGYGVANPISEVLNRMRIDLVIEAETQAPEPKGSAPDS